MSTAALAPEAIESRSPLNHLYEIIVGRAKTYPHSVAIGGQEGLAWKTLDSLELLQLVDTLADELSADGVTAGDRVVIWLPNHWQTPIYLFALWKLGAIVIPFDREMNPEAGSRIIDAVSPRQVLVGYDERPPWASSAAVTEWWVPGTRASSIVSDVPWTLPPEPLAMISFTSGTTGDPKGCMISHANLCSQIQAAFERLPLGPDVRIGSILPLSHLFELTAGLLYPLAAGAVVHYIPSRRGPDVVRVLAEQHITHMLAVPQILTAMGQAIEAQIQQGLPGPLYRALASLADHLPLEQRRILFRTVQRRLGGNLRVFVAGGAALPSDTHRLWERLGIRVMQGYGASECSPMIACATRDGRTPVGSVGKPIQGVEVRRCADGELLVRGPNVMSGYWADPARTATVLDEDGWYHTGDLGTIDSDGNLWLVGRKKELIVLPSGMKVWPEDVETVLRAHPAVKDAAVVAVPTATGGAALHAYVVPVRRKGTDLQSVVAKCNGRLASHQRLSSASWWPAEEFPRTQMLKLRRHLLPTPAAFAGVRVDSTQAVDDPVSQALLAVAHVASVTDEQTLRELGLDSLGLVDLAITLEDKTGKTIGDDDLRLDLTVRELRQRLRSAPAEATPTVPSTLEDTTPLDVPLWPYTYGRRLRALGVLVDAVYALGVSRTLMLGREHLVDLPSPVIFAGTHHGFADMPLLRYALARTAGPKRGWRLVTAIASGGFNSSGPRFGTGFGFFPWYGILALGLFPIRQLHQQAQSLRRLVRVAAAGNDILIFPQGTHARPEDERAGDLALRFRPGVGHLAHALAADVVPFGVAGTERVMPPDPSAFRGPLIAGVPIAIRRGPLAIAIGPRMTIGPTETADAFAARLQDVCYGLTRQAEQALNELAAS